MKQNFSSEGMRIRMGASKTCWAKTGLNEFGPQQINKNKIL
jgi:hypothetical protein